ncbi:MAG: ECF transporter S component [Oscillospiraceae bacterium]|nr:ECF transporter S component [Oscillospiraceae bacterium]
MSAEKTIDKPRLSIKFQTLAAITAIVGAVAVPQIFHVMGAVSGLGTKLGETFLPMHLPIILAGLLAGPWAGAAAGLLGPLASSLLSGMPGAIMLPFMMIELCAYGLISGLLRTAKLPAIGKVLIAQTGGRAVRAAAILFSVSVLGNTAVNPAIILTSISAGIFGIVLQWALIPLIIFRIEKSDNK